MADVQTISKGTLYLLPVPLGPGDPASVLPRDAIAITRRLDRFVVENAKAARAILKLLDHPVPLREIVMDELNEHTPSGVVGDFLQVLREGHDLGLMSDAGCPAVADPGSRLVELAHKEGIRVVPVVGPSSILLALMASGMNGQRFAFNGYLPNKEPDRTTTLKRLESDSRRTKGVEIFIETPYRNQAMLDAVLQLNPSTRLCIACDITLASEWIRSAPISTWKKNPPETPLDRRPAVFLIQAS
jgi:16S rRNA (cytidine1402-2'-O)-methyltransferase